MGAQDAAPVHGTMARCNFERNTATLPRLTGRRCERGATRIERRIQDRLAECAGRIRAASEARS
jgi:hypothetical protein